MLDSEAPAAAPAEAPATAPAAAPATAPAAAPRGPSALLQSEQLGVKASIGGLGRVEVNLDTTVLQAVLQQLTGAIDTKFALVTEQLAEAQQDLAHKTQLLERTRNELEDVTNRLGTCVTWQDLEDVKTMESRLKSQFSKQLDRVSSEAAGAVEKLREQKADKEVVDRLIDRESVERLASMEVALSQQARAILRRAKFFGARNSAL